MHSFSAARDVFLDRLHAFWEQLLRAQNPRYATAIMEKCFLSFRPVWREKAKVCQEERLVRLFGGAGEWLALSGKRAENSNNLSAIARLTGNGRTGL